MTQTAAASIKDVDVTVMLFEPSGPFTESELKMIEALRQGGPALAVINKVDLLRDFSALEARERELKPRRFRGGSDRLGAGRHRLRGAA